MEKKQALDRLVEMSRVMAAAAEERRFTPDEMAEIANLVREHCPSMTGKVLYVWGQDLGQCERCLKILPHDYLQWQCPDIGLIRSKYLCELCR